MRRWKGGSSPFRDSPQWPALQLSRTLDHAELFTTAATAHHRNRCAVQRVLSTLQSGGRRWGQNCLPPFLLHSFHFKKMSLARPQASQIVLTAATTPPTSGLCCPVSSNHWSVLLSVLGYAALRLTLLTQLFQCSVEDKVENMFQSQKPALIQEQPPLRRLLSIMIW